jgi:uncharacterized membrane protein
MFASTGGHRLNMANNGRGGVFRKINEEQVAQALGWFSIGLGVAELLAPRAVARVVGVKPKPTLTRLMGLREVVSGIGLLSQKQPIHWLQARLAGDAIDLALLGAGFKTGQCQPAKLALTTAAVAGVTVVDALCAREMHPRWAGHTGAVHVKRTVTINRSAQDLFQAWRRFEDLPRFMDHLESVQSTGPNRWHWVAKGPLGSKVEWDAEIFREHPNEMITWRSLPGADVDHVGSVWFEPAHGGQGTIVRVQMEYHPPAGKLGAKVAKLFGEAPEKQIAMDLMRFKQLMETGEVARTEGQPAPRSSSTSPS